MKTSIQRLSTAALLVAGAVCGQQKRPSPPAQADLTLGGHDIAIKYSAPFAKGRAIWGGLVPYGQVWRLGANEATGLSTGADMLIGDLKVPAGKYTLYMLPGDSESLLIVNKQTGQWGTEYDEKQDLGRVKLTRSAVSSPIEQFVIKLEPGQGGGVIEIEWEKTKFTVPVKLAH